MKFAGLVKNSFVDFPNNISAVVFTFGCNFNCWYCHNRRIIEGEKIEIYSEDDILNFLDKRKGQLDGLVISGGEPTLCNDLESFIKKVKEKGFLVKLDTNGSNPEVLEKLISKNLLDFVAMDVKTSLEKYEEITQGKVDIEKIKKSIELLKNSKINYEFRTTFAPDVSLSDIEEISKLISNAKAFAIQKYNPPNESVITIPHSYEDFEKALEIAKKYVINSFLRSA